EPACVAFLTSGERGVDGVDVEAARRIREAEAAEALHVLGVERRYFFRLPDLGVADNMAAGAARLGDLLRAESPSVVHLPPPGAAHPDHESVLPLVRAALRTLRDRPRPELRGYEVWTPMSRPGWPEDISEKMARKLRAVRCYRSQLRTFRYDRAVRGLNLY